MKPLKPVRSRRAGLALAVGTAGSLLMLAATAAPANSATPPPHTKVAVPQGIGQAALHGLQVFGTTPAATPETVSFVMKARSLPALEHNVEAGMPSGTLSVSQFAREYGQSARAIGALRGYLAHYGITSTAYPDGLDVTATGTAGQFDAALSVTQKQYRVPAVRPAHGRPGRKAMMVHGTTGTALLPYSIARNVLSILGLSSYPAFASTAVHTPRAAAGVTLKPSATLQGNLTPEDFAKQYNVGPLYRHGATGAGQTIGIVTLASLNPADPYYFWQHILGIQVPANRISLINVDGGAGPVSDALGSGETTLDVEQSGALAPQAHIDVYQAPNTDFGFADAFFAAASQNVASAVSASWGESETAIAAAAATGTESPAYVQAYDEAFLELAAQGQSTFNSSGDFGAYTAAEDIGTTNLSVSNPADSPYLTAAGGTTLPGHIYAVLSPTLTVSATIKAQRTWGWDWLWPLWQGFGAPSEAAFAESEPIGSGGGFSAVEPTPLYQRGVSGVHHFSAVEYLTPTDYQTVSGLTLPTAWNFTAAPSVTSGYGNGRAVPDVSANADPFTGYEEYFTGFTGAPLESGWGGTSFVAPQFAGVTALMNQYVGHRVGFWNPAIYKFAQRHDSPFTPLGTSGTSNDNLYYTGTPGQTYDVGSGLGTPDFALLAHDFASMRPGR